jgi:hypothetical protein
VKVKSSSQTGLGGEPIVNDPAADFAGEGRIAQDRFVNAEDGRFVVPNLLLDFILQRAQLRGRFIAGGLEAGQLGGDFVVFQALGVGVHEDLVNAKRGSDGHARRDGNSFAHRRAKCTTTGGN